MLRFAANLDTLFGEVGFLERIPRARVEGFDGVEYASPYAYAKAELAALLREHGLEQVLIHLPPCDFRRGDRGIACQPERRAEFRDGVGLALEYAQALGCRRVACWAGVTAPGTSADVALDTCIDNLRFAATALAGAGVQLLIEPLNTRDVPGSFLSQSTQGLAMIEATGSENVGLAYDIYHIQVMQGYLVEDIRRCFPRIAHFQIADHPGRHQPGTGDIDCGLVLRLIERLGYTGWVGCEYQPLGSTHESLAWLSAYRRGAFG